VWRVNRLQECRKAALKTHALQTLREVRWRWVVAKRLECGRFIAALGREVKMIGNAKSNPLRDVREGRVSNDPFKVGSILGTVSRNDLQRVNLLAGAGKRR
jgi:hypothetical protein